jgi:hypothetical protein
MGTTYETMLVAADFAAVTNAVSATGRAAIVVPAAAERVTVLTRGGMRPLAEAVSAQLRCPVLTSFVFDSDFIECFVYQDGRRVHRYVSEQEMMVQWFEDDDGVFKPEIDGTVYPADHPIPKGPLGADAVPFAAFAIGVPDLDNIDAALRGAIEPGGERRVMAEQQHWAIMEALKLPVEQLALDQDHDDVDPSKLPTAAFIAGHGHA